jgi:2-polyprenyl-3-methyl-5-hydroxy-6-metoxy-1,4-benzoquinol methylase
MTERFNNAASTWDKGDMRTSIASSVFQTLSNRIALNSSMDILDFGAGTGLLSFKIRPHVRSVCGVDLSINMLEQIELKNSDGMEVKPICQDILDNPLEEHFHGIVSSMAMHHVEDTQKLFNTFYSHLRKDGFVAIADLEAEDGSFHSHGNDGVYHFGFDRDTLRQVIENAGFGNVRFHHAYTVEKEVQNYPIFLVTAHKSV